MTVPVCEHLDDYGVLYVRAEAAYKAMLAQVDVVAAGVADDDTLDLLERMLRDWREEVESLRRCLVDLVRRGRVVLPEGACADVAGTCDLCGEPLPRLVFPDFTTTDAGAPTYRGTALPQPVGA
jgi:hypothetical protein